MSERHPGEVSVPGQSAPIDPQPCEGARIYTAE